MTVLDFTTLVPGTKTAHGDVITVCSECGRSGYLCWNAEEGHLCVHTAANLGVALMAREYCVVKPRNGQGK